ncbi:MAG: hypothetical protein K6G69_06440 [Lachnospiraceae bacterium]|nr:hypothetical protein [Lachnospiraceae bacterium]
MGNMLYCCNCGHIGYTSKDVKDLKVGNWWYCKNCNEDMVYTPITDVQVWEDMDSEAQNECIVQWKEDKKNRAMYHEKSNKWFIAFYPFLFLSIISIGALGAGIITSTFIIATLGLIVTAIAIPMAAHCFQQSEYYTACAQKISSSELWEKRSKERKEKEAQALQAEQEFAIKSQSDSTPWNKRYFTDPCPYCGHYKVRYASWDDKKLSVAFWGVWSNKVGKNFHCDYCNRTFNN